MDYEGERRTCGRVVRNEYCGKPADYALSCTKWWCCTTRYCAHHFVNINFSDEGKKFRAKHAYWDKKAEAWHEFTGSYNDLYCL